MFGPLFLLLGAGMMAEPSTAFLHPLLPTSQQPSRSFPVPPCCASSSDPGSTVNEGSIDPFSVMYGDDDSFLPTSSPRSDWGVADDWSALSAVSSTPNFNPSSPNVDYSALQEADCILQEQGQMFDEQSLESTEDDLALASLEVGYMSSLASKKTWNREETDEEFVQKAVDMISNNYLDYADDDGPMYDTVMSSASTLQKDSSQVVGADADGKVANLDHDDEIAYMIRCNQSPQQLLISQGRALPELTNEMKYKAEFLLEGAQGARTGVSDDMAALALKPQMTPFFQSAVKKIFDTHSIEIEEEQLTETDSVNSVLQNGSIINVDNQHASKPIEKSMVSLNVMNREGISQWMTQCLATPVSPSEMTDQEMNSWKQSQDLGLHRVGPYDLNVNAILSRYSQNHGSGRLEFNEFQDLYLECAWVGYIRDLRKNNPYTGSGSRAPSIDVGMLVKGRRNTDKMLENASLGVVWRDLEAHGIFSPAEEERVELLKEIERLTSSYSSNEKPSSDSQLLMDECLLFDDYEDRLHQKSYSENNDEDRYSFERLPAKKEKSSYELVEMAFDKVTPKRIRDGQFVFIDEESCIGCAQCARISPASFKMIEDTGRARTYFQRNTIDIEDAVMSCPVNCMHYVSFDELKEMEKSRDSGDGKFGRFVPLHVAGRDSDVNRKSSWYHYLKTKCSGERCPQRGCYDCPKYAPGENPFFKQRHTQSEHIRALDFMATGEADKWRNVVDL